MNSNGDGTDSGIKAVERSFGVVEALLKLEGATTVELADRLEMPVSTAFDHLDTLQNLEYVFKRGDEYHVSSKFLYIGTQLREQRRICQAARPELVRLSRETGQHAVLGVEENGYVVNYDIAESDTSISLLGDLGTRALLHMAATGKALLAYMDEDRIDELVERHGLPAATERTITTRDELDAELEQIRDQRYALDREEIIEGTYGMAVPILDHASTTILGSVGVYAAADHEIEPFRERIQAPLERSAHSIELALAYGE